MKINKKLLTKHHYHNNEVICVCDVVKIDQHIYTVKSDQKFHPINNKNQTIWSTSKKIYKIGTIEEYPEYFI